MEFNLPHLALKPPDQSIFTSTSQGGKKKQIPFKNPQQHSAFLQSKFQVAWKEADNETVAYHSGRHGVYLEFKSYPNVALITKSLEDMRSKKVRLLNIREETTSEMNSETGVVEEQAVTFATVYVSNDKKEFFLNKIQEYAEEETKSGKPKNADFINSINDLKKALLIESFWLDRKDLIPGDQPEWCEVWLSSDKDDVLKQFTNILEDLQIESKQGFIRFPERMVKVIHANRNQLEQLTRLSDQIAEYRRAKVTARFWLDLENKEQAEWVDNVLHRLRVYPESNLSICLLDTGVNNGHPLIGPILTDDDCQGVDPAWGTHDHDKHGTLMAGVAAYGDLQSVISNNERIPLRHLLESVKILPPTRQNSPDLWGFITAQGVFRAEIQASERTRIHCMAITSDDTRDRGRPSSWSAELDQLCAGARDGIKRLFIVCAGNVTDFEGNYPEAQLTDSIHDPAQSWNALTVGAYTVLDTITDPTLSGYTPLAPAEGLSPFTTTSLIWEGNKWPIKPEIVMEGGNLARNKAGLSTECDDLSVLSTFYKPQENNFYPFCMTSAATAQAAWFAAQIQIRYPDYWPETIRALMVHSAEWTDTLLEQFNVDLNKKGEIARLMRICGYGVPDLNRAIYCASNSLTLVAQSELQPFAKKEKGSGLRTKDMHLHELPWPKGILLGLPSETEMRMRVTLSYFIEPGPGEIGWRDRYRYACCGLRYDINSPGETREDFVRRINAAARDEENGHPGTNSASDYWVIGQTRDKGSIHSDIWKGSAAELAGSSFLAVFPRIGWWRERSHLGKWDRQIRYSLIVSISAPSVTADIDIYTEVANTIGVVTPIEIHT